MVIKLKYTPHSSHHYDYLRGRPERPELKGGSPTLFIPFFVSATKEHIESVRGNSVTFHSLIHQPDFLLFML